VLPLSVLLAGCPPEEPPEGEDMARATALAVGDSLTVWPEADAGKPVLLYVDRSQSMRGFLDPEYPTRVRTDYRAVLDGFAARLRPAQVFGFGNRVSPADGGLAVLGSADFYRDGNTQMEDVFPLVRADSTLGSTHVIIGDGRRGDPDAANGQFEAMRTLAEWWTEQGGTFVVAASHAPFRPVKSDASGCRGADQAERETCPLYAFAFVAPGDQGRVAAALAATFEALFVTPLPAVHPAGVGLAAAGTGPLTLEPGWAKAAGGAPIARVRGAAATNQPLRARIVFRDTASSLGRGALAALRGRRLEPDVSVRGLADETAAAPWKPAAAGGLLRTVPDSLAFDFVSRGPYAQRHLYVVEMRPAGEPLWLDAFDAERASDARRTFGLGRLFESFKARSARGGPAALRLYVVVN
jgi:hypothetical protein